eukprot:CAMPEP_0119096398 /NCGR_PEP_ID=MMETSP1178-20130426/172736_1 /TAXON_ID=33656 /ORGANISM="unid sp, Strain CCMP2000" /LENGTH=75 /DNA_ID=CAMNT_0007080279 /DNA_START=31 /DNA_END=255 /DNA_ORIENTATION=-
MTEFHFSVTLRMASLDDVERIRYTAAFLLDQNFRSLHFARNWGSPFDSHPGPHPDLAAAGLHKDFCCYMYVFLNE